ncbi:MAG: hypothetical protein U0174_22515 [Polyangiaceae bacterium]
MRSKLFLPFLALVLALASLLSEATAHAQTVTINPQLVRRDADGKAAPGRPTSLKLTDINLEDCVNDRSYDIPVTLAGFDTSVSAQVWAGAQDCSPLPARTAATQVCWRVLSGTLPRVQSTTPNIKVRDILASVKTKGDSYVGPSTADVCTDKNQQTISVYIFWVKGDGSPAGTPASQAFNVDTVGPAPPTEVKVTAGDRLLNLSWKSSKEQSDIQSYNAYCDVSSATAADGGTDSSVADADAGLSTADASADPGDGGVDGTASSDAGSAAAADSGTTNTNSSTCKSSVLTPGKQAPVGMVPCGSVAGLGAGSLSAKGLVNGSYYRVGIAAVDKYGNPGVLSELVCDTPVDVIDFFETYRDSGGTGGGCSMHSSDAPAVSLVGGFAGLVVLHVVRRRKSAKRSVP